MARPKTEIDKKIFEGLCEIQCTKSEICNVIKCDEKTLTRWCKDIYGQGFSDTYKKESEAGKMSLRRMQWEAAEKGNTTMLVWLGKQYLNQTDKQEIRNPEPIKGIFEIINGNNKSNKDIPVANGKQEQG